MAQEFNDGTAYLLALKQSGAQHSETSPSQAVEGNPQDTTKVIAKDGDRFQGAEKRRSPRYKCEGSAEVREERSDVRTWATFTDVSVNGCYVEAQTTYPASTSLHMKPEATGMKVETKGPVRVTYPYLGMGIAFQDMSEENRDHLKRMLATLAHRTVVMGPGIASSLPATAPLEAVPVISNPQAAIQALTEFFENRQTLMPDDFLRVLKKSQQ